MGQERAIHCCTTHPTTISGWKPNGRSDKTENHLRIFRGSKVKKFLPQQSQCLEHHEFFIENLTVLTS